MNKKIYVTSVSILAASLLLCGSAFAGPAPVFDGETGTEMVTYPSYYNSTDDVTVESVINRTTPSVMLDNMGPFAVHTDARWTDGEQEDTASYTITFSKDNDIIECSLSTETEDDTSSTIYYSTTPDDCYAYQLLGDSAERFPLMNDELDSMFLGSFCSYEFFDRVDIDSVKEENGKYIISLSVYSDETAAFNDVLTVDPATGFAEHITSEYKDPDGSTIVNDINIEYNDKLAADRTPKDRWGETASPDGRLTFSTVDIHGEAVTEDIIKDAKVVMLNFWEPWCGPCVGEMPDLEKLYEKYKDQGLLILGVYSSEGVDEDALAIVEGSNITYPVIKTADSLSAYAADYVPCTVFFTGSDKDRVSEQYVGARSYDEWEALINEYLAQ